MECPECGVKTSKARRCTSCGHIFEKRSEPPPQLVRVSHLAVVSAIFALIGPFMLVASFFLSGLSLRIAETVAGVGGMMCVVAVGVAIAGAVEIGRSGGQRTGYAYSAVGAGIPLGGFAVLVVLATISEVKTSYRMSCGTNLSEIGKAMLIYANDYDGRLPVAGGDGTVWGPQLEDWAAEERSDAFGLGPDGAGGQATISSSLYLLVRYMELPLERFVCREDRRVRPFDPNEYPAAHGRAPAVWDFGPDPVRHCSYAYHLPYASHALTTTSEPGMAVAADRNPWIDGPFWDATDFSRFEPAPPLSDGTMQQARYGNSIPHKLDGQNVLFLDSHVEFARQSCCGLEDENIYTRWNEGDKWRGTPPEPYDSTPADERDSLLVNDPAAP